jgi:hypothetical protein
VNDEAEKLNHTRRAENGKAATGRLMCIIMPSGFEGFFEEIGAMSPQQQQDIPRVMGIVKARAGNTAAFLIADSRSYFPKCSTSASYSFREIGRIEP